jgi:serine/threonine-protein kinase
MRLGAYEVVKQLGAGAMGIVFHVRGPDGSEFALKLLKDAGREGAVARFERERRLLEGLGEEAGFVPLLGAGTFPQGPYILMPFLSGGTLRDRFEKGPLPLDQALELGRTLSRAVGRAHALGIVHRDLKPENVLFTASGVPLVADLGLAKHFAPSEPGQTKSISLTRHGDLQGTAGYMSPEQMGGGAKDAGPESDVFALGAILYEGLAGSPAFEGESLVEVFDKVIHGRFEPLRKVRPGTPWWLARVIHRALARRPAARFVDGAALLRALERGARPGARSIAAALAGLALVFLLAGLALRHPATPGATTPVAPVATRAVATHAKANDWPDWYEALPKAARPTFPLPRELTFGANPGEYVNKKDGSVLVFLPADTFLMGSDLREENEKPRHEVELSAHYLGKYEVTNAQFERFVAATHFEAESLRMGSDWRHPRADKAEAIPYHPVVFVTWGDARAYCAWAGLRLPTEAEWEHAAGWDPLARRSRLFAWGDTFPARGTPILGNVADESMARTGIDVHDWFVGFDDGFAFTAPVGSFPAGVSPSGALDMTGNVTEFCADGFDPVFYQHSPRRDPFRAFDSSTVDVTLRGGSFSSEWWRTVVSYRGFPPPDFASDYSGFRVCRGR